MNKFKSKFPEDRPFKRDNIEDEDIRADLDDGNEELD